MSDIIRDGAASQSGDVIPDNNADPTTEVIRMRAEVENLVVEAMLASAGLTMEDLQEYGRMRRQEEKK